MPERGKSGTQLSRVVICLILAGYLLVATAYSIIVPLGEAPDEVSHYAYVRVLAREHVLPAPKGMAFGETFQPPLYYLTAALTNFWVSEGSFIPQANADFDVEDPSGPPNLLLHPRQEDFPYHGGALAWHLIRLYSVLLGAGTVFATYRLTRLLFPTQQPLAWASASFVAFLPEFLFLSGAVNNDNLSTMLSAFILLQLCRTVAKHTRKRDDILLGLLLGLGVLTKTSLWTFVPVAGGVLLWRARKEGMTPMLLTGCVAALVAGPWLLHNILTFGDPLGWSATRAVTAPRLAPLTLDDYMGLAVGLYVSFWGAFGGAAHLLLPDWVLQLLLVPVTLSVAGLGKVLWDRRQREDLSASKQPSFIVLVAHLVVVLIAFLFWSRSVLGTGQGRLLFPALPTMAIFFVRGLTEWIPDEGRPKFAAALPVAMFLFGATVLLLQIRPTYAQPAHDAEAAVRPSHLRQADFRFGDDLRLIGYDWPATVDDRVAPGTTLTLTLVWQADRNIRQDYRLTLQLVDRHGKPSWLKEGSPSAGWETTDRWQDGDVITSRHKVTVPRNAPPGWTRLLVSMHPAGSNEWLPIHDAGGNYLGDTIMLGQMTVKKPAIE